MYDTTELDVDIGILGGGPAGYVAAIRAAQLGASVALIEEREVGGTCLNRGCIPTKALLKSSEVVCTLKKAREFGITASLAAYDIGASMNRKDRVVKNLRMGLEHLLSKNRIQVVKGKGKVVNPNTMSVLLTDGSSNVIRCKKLIITTGSEPLLPDIKGIHLKRVITSDEALDMAEIPDSMLIIGAGAIGMEFACLYNALGTKVIVVEMQDGILPYEDRELADELMKIMKRQGIKFKTGAGVKEILDTENGLEVSIEENGEKTVVAVQKVLVAVGRKLGGISDDIAALGVQISKGAIVVNDHMETSIPGVYAAGDVIGGKLLAHLGFAEGKAAAENALGIQNKINYNAVPSCVYTSPEIASVGMNENQAKVRGYEVSVGRFDFRNNGRALCLGEREGFVKVVVDKKTGLILGAQILGPMASEMISEISLAVSLGAKAEVLADMIHPHPTLSEAVMEACADAMGRAVHK